MNAMAMRVERAALFVSSGIDSSLPCNDSMPLLTNVSLSLSVNRRSHQNSSQPGRPAASHGPQQRRKAKRRQNHHQERRRRQKAHGGSEGHGGKQGSEECGHGCQEGTTGGNRQATGQPLQGKANAMDVEREVYRAQRRGGGGNNANNNNNNRRASDIRAKEKARKANLSTAASKAIKAPTQQAIGAAARAMKEFGFKAPKGMQMQISFVPNPSSSVGGGNQRGNNNQGGGRGGNQRNNNQASQGQWARDRGGHQQQQQQGRGGRGGGRNNRSGGGRGGGRR